MRGFRSTPCAQVAAMSSSALLIALGLIAPTSARSHSAPPPPPPVMPPPQVEEIPEDDADQYRSRVTAIRPRVPGLRAQVIGRQEKLEITWTGKVPLVVEGSLGEPMLRMSSEGVEANERSPTAILSTERYAQVRLPDSADPKAPPRWRFIASPGPISFYEHRAQWMEADRPEVVGDGARALTIFHWEIPARLGKRSIAIRGALDWLPDAEAIRDQRSEVSSPLLSAAILAAALGAGWLAGIGIRRHREDR